MLGCMADVEQVALIRCGAKVWNEWRDLNPDVAAYLFGADLRNADLCGADLRGADLREANLDRANLFGADLRMASLEKVSLVESNLGRIDLNRAVLIGAVLTRAELIGADLSVANLSAAILNEANLRSADLSRANLRGAHLTGATLIETNFVGADLEGANFDMAGFLETVFANTNLRGVQGLSGFRHYGPSILDHRTLAKSGPLPLDFLRGCGLPDNLIGYLPSLVNDVAVQFYSCFISYSHADKSFARRLHDTLQRRGIRCWLDEKQLLPGHNIYDEVDRGIQLWDKVLLCCSKDSLTSWWVDNEIGKAFAKEQALMKERKRKILVLVPLDLDRFLFSGNWDSGKASQIRERLAADFTGWDRENSKFEEQVDRLILALRTDEEGRDKPPVSKL
jgi:hypothetical protein